MKINGTTSGSVTLAAPATGSDVTLTLPGSAGTAALTTDTGLAFITSSTFSAVSSVSVNNCFTSTYKNYAVLLEAVASTTNVGITLRMRASATDNSSSNYKYGTVQVQTKTSNTPFGGYGNGLTTGWNLSSCSDTEMSSWILQIRGPQTTDNTNMQGHFFVNFKTDDGYYGTTAGAMSVTTSYDGFSIIPSTGTITGTVRVYGYRNS